MIPGLDGLRAVAFILVFFCHTNYLSFGWVGVLLFFVLSGFLITGILVDMKENLPAKAYFIKFYGRRFLRIFPLYYFYLFLALAVALLLYWFNIKPLRMLDYFRLVPYALTYIYDFLAATTRYRDSEFLTHFWSLSVEEQFYIFWPLLILLTPKKSYKKLFLAAIIAAPIFRATFTYLYDNHTFYFLRRSTADAIYALPFSHLDAFGLGAFISQYRIPKARQQFWVLLIAIPIIGFATQYLATGDFGLLTGLGYSLPISGGYKQVWGYSLLNYFFAVTIYAVAREGLFNRFLELGWMKYLGKISYGLYVYHYILIFVASRNQDLFTLSLGQAQLVTAAVSFLLTFLMATLSYKYLERPILNLKDKYFPATENEAKMPAIAPVEPAKANY
jgi:peptidoglycan/LPS O-acetylase OafA/YrhL